MLAAMLRINANYPVILINPSKGCYQHLPDSQIFKKVPTFLQQQFYISTARAYLLALASSASDFNPNFFMAHAGGQNPVNEL